MNGKLFPPEKFEFPFVPYKIQSDFMTELYNVLENSEIGIFESPTGTGKSLSLLCSALKWQRDHEIQDKQQLKKDISVLTTKINECELVETDWLSAQSDAIESKLKLQNIKDKLKLVEEHEEKMRKLKDKVKRKKKRVIQRDYQTKKYDSSRLEDSANDSGEDEFNLIDYEEAKDASDDDNSDDQDHHEKETNQYRSVQIFYCSRTHSQLKQIVQEIRKTVYAETIRVVTLASRQHYCTYANVKRLNFNNAINEKCLELKKSTKKQPTKICDSGNPLKRSKINCRCPYYSREKVELMRDTILGDIIDMEDLITFGEDDKTCPYYSSRMATDDAQIILLPYQMLLQENTRKQLGINLTGNIVIIDEAHNLLDTISSIHSAMVTYEQLISTHSQLKHYHRKYLNRFNSHNLLNLNQLIFVIHRLVCLLKSDKIKTSTSIRMLDTHELISEAEISSVNIFRVLEFAEKSHLAEKVQNFCKRYPPSSDEDAGVNENKMAETTTRSFLKQLEVQQNNTKKKDELSVSVEVSDVKKQDQTSTSIRPVITFIAKLTEKSGNGGFLKVTDNKQQSLKYILLNPSSNFHQIVEQSRSVIVAGGTMQPTTEFTSQLFHSHMNRVRQHFYGHVVSGTSILPIAVEQGPTRTKFLFNYTNRDNPELLAELQRAIYNICCVVPEGVICFFSSYDYLETFYRYWSKSDGLESTKARKTVLRETRNSNEQQLLADYNAATLDGRGGLLFSVIGGKLSEGLNFSDHLGRCVIVVGLPYPNKNSPELQEKIKYLNKTISATAGSDYYENLCMKAVNQSIGRSIRHINDYASVILLDERYKSERIRNKLPGWISAHLQTPNNYGRVQSELGKFFKSKKT